MNLSDLSVLSSAPFVYPSANTATFTSASVDLQQFIGVLKVSQHVGTVSGTNPTLDGKIQHSADGATNWADTGLIFATVTAANNDEYVQLDTRAVLRYARYVGIIGGTNTPSFTASVGAVGAKKVM